MHCEICGRKKPLARAIVEDAFLSVCEDCARFGKKLGEPPKLLKREEKPIEDIMINPSFSTIIRMKREAAGLTVDELASRVNEKASIIHRLEQNRMSPDLKTARKLEKALDIRLVESEFSDKSNT